MRGIKRRELTMLDQWTHAVCAEIVTQIAPIVALVPDQQAQVAGVAPGDLHPDLRVVGLPRRAVNVEDCVGLNIDQQRHFQLVKCVVRAGDVVGTSLVALEECAVDGCTSRGACYLRRVAEKQAPDLHYEVFVPLADRRIVRHVVINLEGIADSGRLLDERLQTPVSLLGTDPKHVRCKLHGLAEPAATIRGGGFVIVITDAFGKFDSLLAEGYFVPHIARRRPNPTGWPILPAY